MSADMLVTHGTKAFALKPSSIAYTAQRDFRIFQEVRERAKQAKERRQAGDEPEAVEPQRYAFLRKHVAKAKKPADILKLAAADEDEWPKSSKVSVKILYGDKDLLKVAAELCEQS